MAAASSAAVVMEMRRPHAASVIEGSSLFSCRDFQALTSACHRAARAAGGDELLIVVTDQPASRVGSSPSAAMYREVGDNS
jgi:hypothetical protein